MHEPVLAPPRQEIMMETKATTRTALSPRNTDDNGRGSLKGQKSATAKRPSSGNMGTPWSESSPSTSPVFAVQAVQFDPSTLPPPPPPPPRPIQTNNNVIDMPPPETMRSRASSKGNSSKGTIDSNPAAESGRQAVVLTGSPSPTRKQRTKDGLGQGQKERPKDASGLLPLASAVGGPRRARDPAEQEQALFEQRLCEDAYGVAVRKINQYGKANLRYVKCMHVDDLNDGASSKRSLSSFSAGSKGRKKMLASVPDNRGDPQTEKAKYALVWGKKKDVQITLDQFTSVRIGKVTERARRNTCPSSRILSLLTNDSKHPALDIEAPTRMDRDKFARAFARFLDVPLEEDTQSVHSAEIPVTTQKTTPEQVSNSTSSSPGDLPNREIGTPPIPVAPPSDIDSPEKEEVSSPQTEEKEKVIEGFWQGAVAAANAARDACHQSGSNHDDSHGGFNLKAVVELPTEKNPDKETDEKDDGSDVSSLTGHEYNQELVEELHNALNELRLELEDSRAEAARAVKVAEQAIQSAEKTSSQDWHNTVTHKAAEAAAQAQKRSAEAMAKQRLAEERLEGERRTAAFWRKQAEVAEEEAGLLQTRAAAAEVRKASIEEQLESERRIARAQIESMKARIAQLESSQFDALNVAVQKNRDLEIELEATRRDLVNSKERFEDVENSGDILRNARRKIMGGRKKNPGDGLTTTLLETKVGVSPDQLPSDSDSFVDRSTVSADQLSKIKAETTLVRQQYELLRRTTTAELSILPEIQKQLTDQVAVTLEASHAEIARLRERLASESASRRKLLNEVQDLRGIVRVYCRLRSQHSEESVFNMPSHETLVLRRDKFDKNRKALPASFEFDRIFEPDLPQQDIYNEVQETCLGVLDGYNITVMAFGQVACGKTRTILGDVSIVDGKVSITDHGIQLQAVKQLFIIAGHRSERFKDTFSLSIVEVHEERLSDLLVGTRIGDKKGQATFAESSSVRRKSRKDKQSDDDASSGRGARLEIRSDLHGETVVQGALTVEVESFDEVVRAWGECIANRRKRLEEQEIDYRSYESSCHVISTLKVTSANITTGHGVVGKLQFVDMASAELASDPSPEPNETFEEKKDAAGSTLMSVGDEMRFTNRSLETLSEVVVARSQYLRSVPYRNSTLTHLLRDSLDSDTKVVFFACVSSDFMDIPETTATLRLASRMRQVTIGKATKHGLTSP